jgi:hypothetical protein
MNEIELKSWEDFDDIVHKNIEDNRQKIDSHGLAFSDYLFRGQADSDWKLRTTLERFTEEKYTFSKYNHLLKVIKSAVGSFTGKDWQVEGYEYKKAPFDLPPNLEFMVYLRHFGFPSPLLDWTRSPYVAAYFAFNSAESVDNVSIYCYQEYQGEGKSHSAKDSHIESIGPSIKTHKRHYIQQSEYTICLRQKGYDFEYCSHEEVFVNGETYLKQDSLTHYKIPFSEKEKVLNKLDLMNISSYSLFGTEESLLEVLARKEIK